MLAEDPHPLRDLFARIGASYGFAASSTDQADEVEGPVPPRPEPTFPCRCGTPLPKRGALCETCSEKERAELRRMALGRARKSLPEWEHARLDNPKIDRRLLAATREWRLTDSLGLTIIGPSGLGKSTLAVALCLSKLNRARTPQEVRLAAGIRYVTAQALERARAQHALGAGDPPLVRTAANATLLVLDDLGKERSDGAVIRGVIEERYNRGGRPNLITSELTLRQLGERYGISDRRRIAGRVMVASTYSENE